MPKLRNIRIRQRRLQIRDHIYRTDKRKSTTHTTIFQERKPKREKRRHVV